jgi:YVTN family beta-propeller protein
MPVFALLGTLACDDNEAAPALGDSGMAATADGSFSADGGVAGDAGAALAGRIYVTIAGTNEVWVIDDQSHAIVQKIPVGIGPAIIVAKPTRDKLYTANWTDNTVSAVDVARAQSKSIALTGRPYVIAISPDGSRLYAGLTGNTIAVIDTQSDAIVASFPTPELPASITVSKDGATLYVAELTGGTLRAVSATTGEVTKPAVPVGGAPAWITITPDGSKVYTLNYTSDDIAVVDTATFAVTKIPTGMGTKSIIGNVTPDGSRLYATNLGTGEVIAIDTKTDAIVQRIMLDARPVGVQFSQNGERLYVSDYGVGSLDSPTSAGASFLNMGIFMPLRDGQVSIFDLKSGARLGDKITVAAGPTSLVVDSP